jgi:hypothetical protein
MLITVYLFIARECVKTIRSSSFKCRKNIFQLEFGKVKYSLTSAKIIFFYFAPITQSV